MFPVLHHAVADDTSVIEISRRWNPPAGLRTRAPLPNGSGKTSVVKLIISHQLRLILLPLSAALKRTKYSSKHPGQLDTCSVCSERQFGINVRAIRLEGDLHLPDDI